MKISYKNITESSIFFWTKFFLSIQRGNRTQMPGVSRLQAPLSAVPLPLHCFSCLASSLMFSNEYYFFQVPARMRDLNKERIFYFSFFSAENSRWIENYRDVIFNPKKADNIQNPLFSTAFQSCFPCSRAQQQDNKSFRSAESLFQFPG